MRINRLLYFPSAILVMGCAHGADNNFGLHQLVNTSDLVAIAVIDSAWKSQDLNGYVQYQASPISLLKGQEFIGPQVCFDSTIAIAVGKQALLFLRRELLPPKHDNSSQRCASFYGLQAGFEFDHTGRHLYGNDFLRVSVEQMSLIAPPLGVSYQIRSIGYSTTGFLKATDIANTQDMMVTDYLIAVDAIISLIAKLAESP